MTNFNQNLRCQFEYEGIKYYYIVEQQEAINFFEAVPFNEIIQRNIKHYQYICDLYKDDISKSSQSCFYLQMYSSKFFSLIVKQTKI